MKKLSLMLALMLALGVFATACSEDDDATATVIATYKQASTGKAVFFTLNGFTVHNYDSTDTSLITLAWRGTYADNNSGTAVCTATNWIKNDVAKEANPAWTGESNGLDTFNFTYTTSATVTNLTAADSITLSVNSSVWTKE